MLGYTVQKSSSLRSITSRCFGFWLTLFFLISIGLLLPANVIAQVCNNIPHCQDESSTSTNDINIETNEGGITTSGTSIHGIYGRHEGTGNINIEATGGSITTSGERASAIFGRHTGTGDINIESTGSSITTRDITAFGIHGIHQGTGNINIEATGGSITTSIPTSLN